MKNILRISVNTFKLLFRKRTNFLIYIILPALLIGGLTAATSRKSQYRHQIVIQAEENSPMASDFKAFLESFDDITVRQEAHSSSAVEAVGATTIVLPAGFLTELDQGIIPPVRLYTGSNGETSIYANELLKEYLGMLREYQAAAGEKGVKFSAIYSFPEYEMQKDIPEQSYFGLLLMLLLFSSVSTTSIILKEKRLGTYSRILTTSVSPAEYILGNLQTNLLILLLQIIIILQVLRFLSPADSVSNYSAVFVILLLFCLCSAAIGLLIAIANSSRSSSGAMASIVIVPTSLVAGCFWPREIMPEMLQNISWMFPQSWALNALRIIQQGGGLQLILKDLGILFLFTVCFFLFSALLIQKSEYSVKNA